MVVGHGKRGIKTQRLSVAFKLTHYGRPGHRVDGGDMDRGTRRRSLVSLRYPRRFERLSIVAHLVLGWQGRFLLPSLFAAGATAIWSRCMPFGTIFVRIYKTLRVTPAMAAGIADPLWSMECVAALIDARSCRGHDNK